MRQPLLPKPVLQPGSPPLVHPHTRPKLLTLFSKAGLNGLMAAVLEGRDNTKIVAFSEVILDSATAQYQLQLTVRRLCALFDCDP
jgi:hypothetical protein